MKPLIEREGDDFVFSWAEPEVRIRVERVRESRDELRARVTVESAARGHIWWGALNLTAARSRAEVANLCVKRDPREAFWEAALEVVAVQVARLHDEGEPPVDLATVEHAGEKPYLISNLLPMGDNAVIYADGMAGKSLFLRAICLSLLTETPLHRLFVPFGRVRILWLDWEGSKDTNARWFSRLAAGLGLERCPEVIYKRMLRPIQDEAALLRRYVVTERFGLVCADSLSLACGGDPRDPGIAVAAMNAFHSLDTTVAILAHITKAEAIAGGPSTIFGSRMFRNETRSEWELQAVEGMPPGEHAITLYQRKTEEDQLMKTPVGLRFVFEPKGGPIAVSEYDALRNVAAARGLTQRQQIAACLSADPKAVYELVKLTGIPEGSVGRLLRMMQGFEAERVEGGSVGRGQVTHWIKADRRNGKADGSAFGDGGKVEPLKEKDSFRLPPSESSLPGDRDQRDARGYEDSLFQEPTVPGPPLGYDDDEEDLGDVPF